METQQIKRVLVTGGSTFLGMNIAAALLSEGIEVTLAVRPGTENRLGPLASRVRWFAADVWDPASLRGRARGNQVVIHTVGSLVADPARGLTYHRLNVVSARNAANMCISDGVPHIILMSTTSAPWVNRHYVQAKREAESYLSRIGLRSTIVRAPIAYMKSNQRPLFYRFVSLLGAHPPLSWTYLGRIAPMPMDVLARGVSRIAIGEGGKRIYYANDLRRLNKRANHQSDLTFLEEETNALEDIQTEHNPFDSLDEDTPFGWIPPNR